MAQGRPRPEGEPAGAGAPGWLPRWRGFGRAPGAAPRTAVVTDTAAALPADWVAAHSGTVAVVPLPVMVDGQIYTEGLDDVESALAMALATGRPVRTSRPAPGLMLRTYRELAAAGATEIVSVHLSGHLSGTVEAARWAAGESPVPVTVVDSETVGMAQGFAVMDAAAAAADGRPAAAVAGIASAAHRNGIAFAVPGLEQLRRGGRIGTAAGMIGTLLAVKPILGIDGGRIVLREKVRTFPRAVARLGEWGRDQAGLHPGGARLAVHHFGSADQARELVGFLAPATDLPILEVPLPTVLAAHTGAGVLGVVAAPASSLPGPTP